MEQGRMLVRAAAWRGDLFTLSWLLNKRPSEIEIVAAMSGNQPDALRLLIEAGGDVNTGLFGGNIILEGVKSNRIECTKILLDAGAARQRPGQDLMHVAAEGGLVEMGQLLAAAGVSISGHQAPQGVSPL